MSTEPTPPPAPPRRVKNEIVIYSHSSLFYWWPVWFFGFVFALWTYFEDNRMLIVPPGSVVESAGGEWNRMTINWPQGMTSEQKQQILSQDGEYTDESATKVMPKTRASREAWMAPIFFLILLLNILITNVPLRGLWSVVVIITIVLVAVIFALMGWWGDIFIALGNLHVFINMAGYIFMATVLFVVWALAFWIFDRRTYIVFAPGQVRVREEIGGREKTYDTFGLTLEKHRDDVFRHYVLGFGTGDLTVKTSGADRQEITIPNVLAIGWRLPQIQQMIRERPTVEQK